MSSLGPTQELLIGTYPPLQPMLPFIPLLKAFQSFLFEPKIASQILHVDKNTMHHPAGPSLPPSLPHFVTLSRITALRPRPLLCRFSAAFWSIPGAPSSVCLPACNASLPIPPQCLLKEAPWIPHCSTS